MRGFFVSAGVPVVRAGDREMLWVREEVRLLIDYHRPPQKVALIDGALHRGFWWYSFAEQGFEVEGFSVDFDGAVYLIPDDPRHPALIAQARDFPREGIVGLDVYITPVASRDWVWIGTHDPLGPFLLWNPECQ